MTYRSIDPSSGQLLAELPAHSRTDVEGLLATAHAAYGAWRTTPLAERAEALLRLAAILERDVESLALLLTSEMAPGWADGSPVSYVQPGVLGIVLAGGDLLIDTVEGRREGPERVTVPHTLHAVGCDRRSAPGSSDPPR